jgi:hypothetical protein
MSLLFDFISAILFIGALVWIAKPINEARDIFRTDHPKTDANKDSWKDYQVDSVASWKFNMMLWQL